MRQLILSSFTRWMLLLLCSCGVFQAKADNETLSPPFPLNGSPLSLRVNLCQDYLFTLSYNIPSGYQGVDHVEWHRTTTYSTSGGGGGSGSGNGGNASQIVRWDQNVCADDISAIVTYYRYVQTQYGQVYQTTQRTSNHIPIIVNCVGNPGLITGLRNVSCACIAQLRYSIPAVANATSYYWEIPNGWSFITNQTSTDPYVIVGPSQGSTDTGQIRVYAQASCSNIRTGPSTITVTRNNETPPLTNNVPAAICVSSGSQTVTYNFAALCGPSSYTFTITPGKSTASSATTATFASTGTTTYTTTDPTSVQVVYQTGQYDKNLVVTANYPCSNSPSASYLMRVHNAVPSQPSNSGMVQTYAGDTNGSPPTYDLRVDNQDDTDNVQVNLNGSTTTVSIDLNDPYGFTTLATNLRGPTTYNVSITRYNACGQGQTTTKSYTLPGAPPPGGGGGGGGGVEEPYFTNPKYISDGGADDKDASPPTAYPSPANEVLFIPISKEAIGGTVRLIDNVGRVVRQVSVTSTQTLRLDTHTVADGLYHILLPGGNSKGQTITIQH